MIFRPHPYTFFNEDGNSVSFVGFFIDRISGNRIDSKTKRILVEGVMPTELYDSLRRNGVPLQENFDDLPKYDIFRTSRS